MIRRPLQTVYSTTVTGTANSSIAFRLASLDIDSLTAKLFTNHANDTGSLTCTIQTSDDGGTTYYDLGAFGVVDGIQLPASSASPLWMVLPLTGGGEGKYVGHAGNLLVSAGSVTGLPILSPDMRINYSYSGSPTSVSWTVTLYANTQSSIQ